MKILIFVKALVLMCFLKKKKNIGQVLRILEGDIIMDSSQASASGYDVGSRSGRLWSGHQFQHQQYSGSILKETIENFSGKLCLDERKPASAFWESDSARAPYSRNM